MSQAITASKCIISRIAANDCDKTIPEISLISKCQQLAATAAAAAAAVKITKTAAQAAAAASAAAAAA